MESCSNKRGKKLTIQKNIPEMANVLSLVPYPFLPARTGGQKAIAQFYEYFSRYENLTCAGVIQNDPTNVHGYTLVPLLSGSPLRYINPLLFFRLRRLIRSTNAQFLLIEHPYFGWLAWLIRRSCRIKLVVRSHNIEGNRWRTLGKWWWQILWKYERFTHRQADYNIFIQDEERNYAIMRFGLDPARCLTMTFGVERTAPPSPAEKTIAREKLNDRYDLEREVPVLLLNGAFRYRPNRQALEDLLQQVNPLLQQKNFRYQILVCGMDIPATLQEQSWPGVKMLGFVEDLPLVLTGADLLLNPVLQGGGIKTKLVEALAFGLNAVSTESGAVGVNPSLCNDKLLLAPDHDWPAFALAIEKRLHFNAPTPVTFFEHFSWDRLAARTADFIAGKSIVDNSTHK